MPGEGLRDRKKRRTRAALARAAVLLAAERGLDHVTVDDISAAAGVSPRTFFNYFAGKEEAVIGPDPDAAARIAARIAAQPEDRSAAVVVRDTLLAEIADELADDPELCLLRIKVVHQHPALLTRLFAAGEETEQHMVAAVAARCGLSPHDIYPHLLAAAAGAAFRVAMTRWASPEGRRDPARLAELFIEAMDLVAAGLADPPHRSDEG
ncbi:TetR/AcrR family transcriptional regulator [Saccharothrix coeruleofusca]|uniref:TetR/AcrR family transcriptional regulator n=1 Tax=Saccharothrix coeruleofusca TaxID=33919 RepID=UPI001E36C976|nr:TetR/AcrR family transcriptional regulator; helix-turn-helix transcriptional regulator [Saccharothrix coeruleofusca]MBP2336245.1 AcrR family transcriptional regulator [Saccharothrix coeruleofusca]